MATATTRNPTTDESVAPPTPAFRPYLWTADRYLRLAESGVFDGKDRVFLWEGALVEKMTIGRPHTIALTRLQRLLDRLMPDGFDVEQEQPMELSAASVPEPDLKVVRGRLEDYPQRPPTAKDVSLIIEVADSSLSEDARSVLRAYARADVPVYWVVNIPKNRIDVHTGPTGPNETPTYTEHRSYGPGDEAPVVLDGREIGRVSVADVLP